MSDDLLDWANGFCKAYPEDLFPSDGTSRDAIAGSALRLAAVPLVEALVGVIETAADESAPPVYDPADAIRRVHATLTGRTETDH